MATLKLNDLRTAKRFEPTVEKDRNIIIPTLPYEGMLSDITPGAALAMVKSGCDLIKDNKPGKDVAEPDDSTNTNDPSGSTNP